MIPTVGAGSPKGPLIPFMLLVFYLSSDDTILVTIQKSDVSTFQWIQPISNFEKSQIIT